MKTKTLERSTVGLLLVGLLIVFSSSAAYAQARVDKEKIGTGTANVITLQSGGVAGNRTISIPDPGASANVILTTLNGTAQSITGPLTISGATPIFSVPSGSSSTLLAIDVNNHVITATASASLTGSGTTGTIPDWSSSSAIGNSKLTDNGSLLNYNGGKMIDTAASGGIFVAGNFHTGGAMQVQSSPGIASPYSATYNDFEMGNSGSSNTITPYDAVVGRIYLIINTAPGNKTVTIGPPGGTVTVGRQATSLVISDGTNWHLIQ